MARSSIRGETLVNAHLQEFFVDLVLRTPLGRYLGYRYQHMFSPAQLSFLVSCLDDTRSLPGPIFEVGCAGGMTTVWLNKHLDWLRLEKPYVAIDTFAGFTPHDIEHEVSNRGKDPRQETALRHMFSVNRKRWVEKTLEQNGVKRVTVIEGDAAALDYSKYQNVSFALVDVDLYLPVKHVLERLYPRMARGGIIVVDDCAEHSLWDGALHAYNEFMAAHAMLSNITLGKLGVIRV